MRCAANLDTCRLIVPTATMAEHLRNELAREGFVFKPALVTTFTKFVEPYCVVDARRRLGRRWRSSLREVLERTSLADTPRSAILPGFRASIVQVVAGVFVGRRHR